ncbi:MAG TPA: hypothetical protein VFG25_07100 [Nitrosopumilaceae archaeon]|nr:hypothetical protein [Nitrosopumilaceae archaeon]
MSGKVIVFSVFLSVLIVFSTSTPAWAAQLESAINPNTPTSSFQMKYQRTIYIEYLEGGQLKDTLNGEAWDITVTADSSNPGVTDLINRLNQQIQNDGSGVQVSDLSVDYSATLTGRELNTSIDYKLILKGHITNYVITKDQLRSLIDMGWRGMTVQGPVVIDGIEINLPISPLKENEPAAYSVISGTEGENLLSEVIIDARGIQRQPLANWHFLFDPTGINVDASQFGLAEEISGFVVSHYTMGESSIREGRQVEQVKEATFSADKNYVIRSIQSADNANIGIIGFGAIDKLGGLEIVGVTPKPPQGYATTSTGGFPVGIIYGMAAMAAIGGGAIFFISNRKLKAEKGQTEQTGIDPSRLRAYQTSAGSGGYQTLRGEAQLADDESYAKTRSVYDEQKSEEPSKDSQSTRGSLPKGFKKD